MPRKKVPLIPGFTYHASARCNNKQWFDIPMEEVWIIMENYLRFIHHAFGIEIIAFVLMDNHFHLLLKDPLKNLGKAMNYFMRETSKCLGAASGRINHIYGGRFNRTLIKSEKHFWNCYKYIYRNPVKAGKVSLVEDYKFSTLFGLIGRGKLGIPVVEDKILFRPNYYSSTLDWLNKKPSLENEELMRLGLRRKVFELPKDKKSGKPHALEAELF